MRIEAYETALGANAAIQPTAQAQTWQDQAAFIEDPESFLPTSVQVQDAKKSGRATRLSKARKVSRQGIIDLREIVKLLKLGDNKLYILKLLPRREWIKLLRLMPQELLVNALRLFSKEKLMKLILHLPKALLLQVLLKMIKLDTFVKKMPTTELMRILRCNKLDNRALTKSIMKLDPQFILLLMQRIYGNYDYSKLKPYDIFRIFMQTDKARITEALKTMPFKVLQQMVSGFLKNDPELLFNLSEAFVFKLMSRLDKPTLILGCSILPPEILINMLCQLPDPMLLLAAAQIDDHSFEDFLINQHADLLTMLAASAA
jgi:hypothetical protein